MTTLVAIRPSPLNISMSNQPDRRTGKRLAAADDFENDDDFVFTRKPKKPRTEEVAAAGAPVRRSPRNKPAAADTATETVPSAQQRRTGAATSPSRDADCRRREASAGRVADQDRKTQKTSRRGDNGDAGRTGSSFQSPPRGTTTIALPTSDTPVMARNKEMRKKAAEGGSASGSRSSSNGSSNGNNNHRRSSLGTRGRRASSLMESGQTAIPHRDLDAQDFYKHIASDGLLEPLRMKTLLTWCGERALPEKPKQGVPSTDPSLGARAILDDLLKEFSTRPEFSNWLARDESVAPAARILKPNPRNIELDKKSASLEARIQRLQEEKNAWLSIQKPPPDQPQLFPDDTMTQETPDIQLPALDLLDADEGRTRKYLAAELEPLPQVRARTQARLQAVQKTLEFEVDHLADNVHKLEQRVRVAGRQADAVLRGAAERLRRREDREKRSAGTREMPMMEILRSLGSLLPEGGGPGL
ncbi:hypothetical protein LMH87_004789 [Akanthomyces muscarius]|uniref:Kinetochore protein mis13 n=1 Tax=Akanthomyces muscarius TaxID=2231603 RepID=A0A9W8Q3Y1_AKAMU|nr:hypothetical protein LMH87_004789 [Akanthomyces muscarius]KAJ4145958.1 hypothetical protein LMH87_004789 [Akanthomyces muscarius]